MNTQHEPVACTTDTRMTLGLILIPHTSFLSLNISISEDDICRFISNVKLASLAWLLWLMAR